jgi:hypothetical protein
MSFVFNTMYQAGFSVGDRVTVYTNSGVRKPGVIIQFSQGFKEIAIVKLDEGGETRDYTVNLLRARVS